jgi:hypothetical protein
MVRAVSALLLLRSGLLAAAALPGIPVGGPSSCPTPDGLWQELQGLLARQDLGVRPPSTEGPPIRIDDLGPSFRVSLLGRSREYRDEARDCTRRARIGALFAALVIDRDENPDRPSRDAAPPGSAKTEEPRGGPEASRESPNQGSVDADSAPLPRAENPPSPPSPPPAPAPLCRNPPRRDPR